jgi:hypothetical protein
MGYRSPALGATVNADIALGDGDRRLASVEAVRLPFMALDSGILPE